MKKGILAFFVLAIAIQMGCMGKINVKEDDFTKSKVLTMYLKPSVSYMQLVMLGENEFYRAVKDGISKPTAVSFTIYGSDMLNSIDKYGMIKVDDQVFNLDVVNAKTQRMGGSTDIEVKKDYAKPDTYSGTGSRHEYKQFSIKLTLTPKIENEIANASAISIRLTIDDKPVTVVYSKGEIQNLKNFITLKP